MQREPPGVIYGGVPPSGPQKNLAASGYGQLSGHMGQGPSPRVMVAQNGPMGLIPSQGSVGGFERFNVGENMDRIKEEWTLLDRTCSQLRAEMDRVEAEKAEYESHSLRYYEMAYKLNIDLQVQAEINKRFQAIMQTMLSHLPPDAQAEFSQHIEQSKAINPMEYDGVQKRQSLPPPYRPMVPGQPYTESPAQPQAPGLDTLSNISAAHQPLPMKEEKYGAGMDDEEHANKKPRVDEILTRQGELGQPLSRGPMGGPPGYPTGPYNANNGPPSVGPYAPGPGGYMTQGPRPQPQPSAMPYGQAPGAPPNNMPGQGKWPEYEDGRPVEPRGLHMMPNMGEPSAQAPTGPPSARQESYAQISRGGSDSQPVVFPPDAGSGQDMPKQIRPMTTLMHNEVVCAVALSHNVKLAFTGGKGCVKVWDMAASSKHVYELPCLKDNYIRSCKLLADDSTLIVGGETSTLSVWDMASPTPRLKAQLESNVPACYALAVSPPSAKQRSPICFTCCSDGSINIWDIHNQKLIRTIEGHRDGASCIDIMDNGSKLVTGGLDNYVRIWDLDQSRQIIGNPFPSQIFSLGVSPKDNWIAAGLENSHIKVFSIERDTPRYQLMLHESCVLSLKYAHKGNWFITTGKDNYLNGWKSPDGYSLFQ
eukprot:Ihof_evm1s357 gene=Ihof_evmTU1s357